MPKNRNTGKKIWPFLKSNLNAVDLNKIKVCFLGKEQLNSFIQRRRSMASFIEFWKMNAFTILNWLKRRYCVCVMQRCIAPSWFSGNWIKSEEQMTIALNFQSKCWTSCGLIYFPTKQWSSAGGLHFSFVLY